jgi:hypothetical protein
MCLKLRCFAKTKFMIAGPTINLKLRDLFSVTKNSMNAK